MVLVVLCLLGVLVTFHNNICLSLLCSCVVSFSLFVLGHSSCCLLPSAQNLPCLSHYSLYIVSGRRGSSSCTLETLSCLSSVWSCIAGSPFSGSHAPTRGRTCGAGLPACFHSSPQFSVCTHCLVGGFPQLLPVSW